VKKILVFVTNHATLGDTEEANGTYAAELTHAVAEFEKAGFSYDIASISGGSAPLYGIDDFDDQAHKDVMANSAFAAKINDSKIANSLNVGDYDAIFYPGGFGLLSDLAFNKDIAKITARHYQDGGLVGAVCHGPAGLLPITLDNGESLLSSKKVTGFTRDEEVAAGTIDNIPFVLQESLEQAAADYSKVDEWQEHIVIDGRLITGQNPASAHAVGKAMVEALS
jgi:putative intracellular protease/amidase